jgi:hypothetical protein
MLIFFGGLLYRMLGKLTKNTPSHKSHVSHIDLTG